ncbi:DUF3290 domain-containing protein [Streptococcus halitosis]|uniref:DUF3290 family protein n=1 Tax=Streptococcus halitosis TaxID=2172545 RepID=UPI0020039FE8|nr:DUF3290 family protein [Streptococcus halitosis]MCK6129131.1 DUF3290 domain-containing protein [Streptococcus halitosis]MCK6216134.1 DUF3290 domain-containing protein [Streptococcus halitosis]
MKFYSYDYVLSQIGQQNGIMVGFGIVLLAVTGFFAFKAYHDKKGTKFRELVMISALTLLALLLVSITTYQNNQVSNNKFQTSLHFIELVSKDLGVDKSEVYVNTSTNTDGALLKVGDRYYRALNGSEPDKYLLEKVELYKTDAIELVEVNK